MDHYVRLTQALREWDTAVLQSTLRDVVQAEERQRLVHALLHYLLGEVDAIYHDGSNIETNRENKKWLLKILLSFYQGAANEAMDGDGNYPLHLAVLYAPLRDRTHTSVAAYVEVLLRNGACATVPNIEGFTPLDLWKERRRAGELTPVVRLLEEAARPHHSAMLEQFAFGQEDGQRPSYLFGCPELTRMIGELTFRDSWEDAQRAAICQIEADGMDGAIFDQRALDDLVTALNRRAHNAMARYREAYAVERPAHLMAGTLMSNPAYNEVIIGVMGDEEISNVIYPLFNREYRRVVEARPDRQESFEAPWHGGRYDYIHRAFEDAGLMDPAQIMDLLGLLPVDA